MTQTLDAIYDGVSLRMEKPLTILPNTRVRVTLETGNDIDLKALGISEEQAAELRAKLGTFEDWNHPDMDIYDNYERRGLAEHFGFVKRFVHSPHFSPAPNLHD